MYASASSDDSLSESGKATMIVLSPMIVRPSSILRIPVTINVRLICRFLWYGFFLRGDFLRGGFLRGNFLTRPSTRIGNISLYVLSVDKRLSSKFQSPKPATEQKVPYCLPRYATQSGSFRCANPVVRIFSLKTC